MVSRGQEVHTTTGQKRPYKRLYDLPPGKYSEKDLKKKGFTDGDIFFLEIMAEEFTDAVQKTRKRKIPVIIFKEGMFSIPRFVRAIPFLMSNYDKSIPKKLLEGYDTLKEALLVFIERGLLKEGCYDDEEEETKYYYWAKNPAADDWIRETCQELEIGLPDWPGTVPITDHAKKYLSFPDVHATEFLFLWCDDDYWRITTRESDTRGTKRWFTVRLKTFGRVDIPPAVWNKIAIEHSNDLFFDVDHRKKAVVLKKRERNKMTAMTDRNNPSPITPSFHPDLFDQKILRQLHEVVNLSISEIAEKYKCDRNVISKLMQYFGIETQNTGGQLQLESESIEPITNLDTSKRSDGLDKSILDDPLRLQQLHWDEEQSIREIARRMGCSTSPVTNAMNKFSIPIRKRDKAVRLTLHSRYEDSQSGNDDEVHILSKVAKPSSSEQVASNLESTLTSVRRDLKHSTSKARKRKSYPELEDHNWLENHYWNEEKPMSINEITNLIGCGKTTVQRALKRRGIEIRKKNIYLELEDREWLENHYWNKEKPMSMVEIASLIGCSNNAVFVALKRHGITRRTPKESLHLTLKKNIPLIGELKQFLTGSLLGDGFLSNYAISSSYTLDSKYREYAMHIRSFFRSSGYGTRIRYVKVKHPTKNKLLPAYRLYVEATSQLLEYRKKWYPDGTKHIPKDVQLTPITCLYWYVEDGTLATYKKRVSFIAMSTECFLEEENLHLVESLEKILDVDGIKINKRNNIYLNKCAAKKFLKYMGGKSPVKCFNYKFNSALPRPMAKVKPQKSL
ncbi:MAG: hypothetical protein ACXAEU_05560 [Candidatus Hodarchaeales archaeon]|jgi:predicted DNA-binding protein YlxM (UPF0122 family)